MKVKMGAPEESIMKSIQKCQISMIEPIVEHAIPIGWFASRLWQLSVVCENYC